MGGHEADYDPRPASTVAAQRLSDMLSEVGDAVKSLARNQAEMTPAFSRLLKMAAAEEGQEEQAEGDFNSAAEADPDDAGEEVEEDEGDADDQDIWASGKARRQERELQEVLAGQRILNANLGQIMQAVSGPGWGNVPNTALDAGSLIRTSSGFLTLTLTRTGSL